MKIGSLVNLLEQLDQNAELAIVIAKENGEAVTTYDVGFDRSELEDFALTVHE